MSFIITKKGDYLGEVPNQKKDILVVFDDFDLRLYLNDKSAETEIQQVTLAKAIFTPLLESSSQQPGYQYPMNTSEKVWQLIESKGGYRPTPTIHNNSSTTVFIKPEGRVKEGPGEVKDHKTPIPLPPGATIFGGIDGVNTWLHGLSVFKTVDGVKIAVQPDGNIKVVEYKNLLSRIGQWWLGGWKEMRNRSSWVALSKTFNNTDLSA
ncbi:MAG: hypothetical protein AB8F74_01485 [Saprospiraceae bacterium]